LGKFHSEELHDTYSVHIITIEQVKTDEMGNVYGMHGGKENAFRALVWKFE
jgi:hypothetical protein